VSPLSGLTNLTLLYLNHNHISDVSPLSGLKKLLILTVEDNNIHFSLGSEAQTWVLGLKSGGTYVSYLPQSGANHAPVVSSHSLTTTEGVPVTVTFSSADADGDSVDYTIVTGPSHGSVGTVSGPMVTYTPAVGYAATNTPASSDWSLALLALAGLSIASITVRKAVHSMDG
jgi:hypothetical protein